MLVLTGATGEITAVTVCEENIVTKQKKKKKKCTCLLEGGLALQRERERRLLHGATAGARADMTVSDG